jgi:alpha-L-fucosidase 2
MRTIAGLGLLALSCASGGPLTLWYKQPAARWVEALPVGNGHMGAMIFGGVANERIQFNEHTVWTGEPHDYAHHGAYRYLGRIRQLLFEGKQAEAEKLAMDEFMSVPLHQKAYQAFGDLTITMPAAAEPANYRRELDLDTAVSSVEFSINGVGYRREVFASWPDQVIVVRLTASKKGALSFEAALKSAHAGSTVTNPAPDQISMSGAVGNSAIRFEARLLAKAEGGSVQARDGGLSITGADSATLLLAGATNFVNYQNVSGDPKKRDDEVIAKVRGKSYTAIRAAHIADHQRLFRRVSLDLGSTAAGELPTDERIRNFNSGHDPQLVALLFQYGRYLLIGSSREGGQPANLQGIWNDSNRAPWDSKYTVNINTEMNYWPAEVTNLADCTGPLFSALKEVAESGAITAREQYNASGWVLHHNFDLWRGTAPINASNHGIWPSGGSWLAHHLWEHYLYSGDKQFLRDTAYPLMRGAALFFADTMVEDPQHHWLITGPSNSPEQGGLVMGPTMDHQIVRSLFGAVIAASRILGVDADLRERLTGMRGRIAPNQIGRYGQLQEWLEDKDDPTNQHRHVSHLWGVFPGADITAYGSPEFFAAARKSLEFRGDAATGWSMGWKVNLWARFLDGAHAYRILQNLIRPAPQGRGVAMQGGLYPNLFDAHPPFQIDGNFGATSGIAEMLLQSHDPYAKPLDITPVESGEAGMLNLLPALPPEFPTGSVTGLRARGGFEVDLVWKDSKLVKAVIRAKASKPARLRYANQEVSYNFQAGRTYTFGPDLKPIAR